MTTLTNRDMTQLRRCTFELGRAVHANFDFEAGFKGALKSDDVLKVVADIKRSMPDDFDVNWYIRELLEKLQKQFRDSMNEQGTERTHGG